MSTLLYLQPLCAFLLSIAPCGVVEGVTHRQNVRHLRSSDAHDAPLVLIYETDFSRAPLGELLLDQARNASIDVKIVGNGTAFEGYGSKYEHLLPELQSLNEDRLVIISDYDDVLLNPGRDGRLAMKRFKEQFAEMTRDRAGAIVVSAEAQCCVGAVTFFKPGEIIALNGSRIGRTCTSGREGCTWKLNGKFPWQRFMKKLAMCRQARSEYIYLNSGLMAGRAADLARVIQALQLGQDEDDQAVMMELLYRFPQQFVLDYAQNLFGNARHENGNQDAGGCIFETDWKKRSMLQRQTGTYPLFLHVPGKFYKCLGKVAGEEAVLEQMNRNIARLQGAVGGDSSDTAGSQVSEARVAATSEGHEVAAKRAIVAKSKRVALLQGWDDDHFTCEDLEGASLASLPQHGAVGQQLPARAGEHSEMALLNAHEASKTFWTEIHDENTNWLYWWNQETNEVRDEQGRTHWWNPETETVQG